MTRLQSLRDAPNTSREYETTYILRPNTANDGVAEINTRVKGIIEGMGGTIVKVDNWGKRRLAYEVAKERKGIYLYWLYLAQPGVVEEIERNLRMLDTVIRYMTIKVDDNVDVGARPTEIDDAAYERAATTAADEEDMFLTRGGDGEDDEFSSDDEDDVFPGRAKPAATEDSAADTSDAASDDAKKEEE
ncbi:MAG: 30S ribosomal protein S6 [Kofleriaceae bacterium]|nr:30S ribosomal protein S6 [Myxococcales bacterium]MCB9565013.1 30S ribosomal protein S6 [Kofleriaceae bacterium]MCB9575074.1 30S ribosomal protein S6 [Kofleriaceae bacterium]